jgi:hypothetical protein
MVSSSRGKANHLAGFGKGWRAPVLTSFSRPEGGDADNVKADLKDGVLTVQIPKRPEVQPKRISLGKGGSGSANPAKA